MIFMKYEISTYLSTLKYLPNIVYAAVDISKKYLLTPLTVLFKNVQGIRYIRNNTLINVLGIRYLTNVMMVICETH